MCRILLLHSLLARELREVKKEDTRLRRAQHAAEYLMEVMEAELDPPPLMKAAFARNAKARQGWERMPQWLRRQYLIVYFPYPLSRYPADRPGRRPVRRQTHWKHHEPGCFLQIRVYPRQSAVRDLPLRPLR